MKDATVARREIEPVLRAADWPADAEAVRSILREYAASLEVDLGFQDFEAELAALPGAYAAPSGRLLLAFVDGALAACGGFRALAKVDEAGACEMKRLYVRPAFRGLGLGRQIAAALLDEARHAGHRAMFLDTLPEMASAQQLYVTLGFIEVPAYRFNPVPGTRYLKAGLVEAAGPTEQPPRIPSRP